MNYDRLANGNPGNRPITDHAGRWVKGQSGNPNGRPKKSLMQQMLEERANDPAYVEKWIEAQLSRSMASGVAGFLTSREILDRVDGPVKQEMDLNVTLGLAETLSKARQRIEE